MVKDKKEQKKGFLKDKIKIKPILKTNRPTLTIQKPRDNPYINRFFNEEWVND